MHCVCLLSFIVDAALYQPCLRSRLLTKLRQCSFDRDVNLSCKYDKLSVFPINVSNTLHVIGQTRKHTYKKNNFYWFTSSL